MIIIFSQFNSPMHFNYHLYYTEEDPKTFLALIVIALIICIVIYIRSDLRFYLLVLLFFSFYFNLH